MNDKGEQVVVRPAQKADLAAIHELVAELAQYEQAAHEFIASLEQYMRDFEAGFFRALIAECAGEVVGMMVWYKAYSTWKGRMIYLEDFVVRQQWRGSGVGKKLFAALIDEARALDCKLIKWQVLDWNESAIRFYEKVGAEIEKGWWNGKLFLNK